MPSVRMDYEVVCGSCGTGLCRESSADMTGGYLVVTVNGCPVCVAEAQDKGYASGYEDGLADGQKE